MGEIESRQIGRHLFGDGAFACARMAGYEV